MPRRRRGRLTRYSYSGLGLDAPDADPEVIEQWRRNIIERGLPPLQEREPPELGPEPDPAVAAAIEAARALPDIPAFRTMRLEAPDETAAQLNREAARLADGFEPEEPAEEELLPWEALRLDWLPYPSPRAWGVDPAAPWAAPARTDGAAGRAS